MLLFLRVISQDGKCTDTLTVETHRLSEGLSEQQVDTSVGEESHGSRVFLAVATCEALVRHVQEANVVLREEDVTDRLPLVDTQVATSRVVSACVHDVH